ncbi:hypothetical protein [Knoellia koreensis]|uniref:Uncharacterized protein n=1 Tax=Knoellia koreensis TaxID=2730921 RepID=A0A849HEQ7_9MICO|nr:hypothetical protein [Knoellia sp. DB2414S]NNM45133.1 hypothetical protein [Knoellia sp. DB2414S]
MTTAAVEVRTSSNDIRNDWRDLIWTSGLTSSERLVALCFASHAKPHGRNVWVTTKRGAFLTDLSTRTWERSTATLVRLGWMQLTRPARSGRDGGRAAEYNLRLVCPVRERSVSPHASGMAVTVSDIPGNERHRVKKDRHSGDPTPTEPLQKTGTPADSALTSGPSQAVGRLTSTPRDWAQLEDDYDAFEAYLEEELGGLCGDEYSTAAGMWEDRQHPKAIRNKIAKQRRQS